MSFLLSQDRTIAIRSDVIKTLYVGEYSGKFDSDNQYYLAVSVSADEADIVVGDFPTKDSAKDALETAIPSLASGFNIVIGKHRSLKAEVSE